MFAKFRLNYFVNLKLEISVSKFSNLDLTLDYLSAGSSINTVC